MRSLCPYTGIEYPVPEFQWLRSQFNPHPIFSLPVKALLANAGKWASGSLTDQEKHLLFIALLKSTNLVEFKSPAQPSISIIDKNIELLMSMVVWKTNSLVGSRLGDNKLPRYICSYPTTHTLDNISVYLNTWNTLHQQDLDTYNHNTKHMATPEWRAKQESLKRLIHSNLKRAKNYEKMLGTWALSASNVPVSDPFYQTWLSYFQLKEPEIYNLQLWQIADLKDHMEEHLIAFTQEGNSIAKAVLVHVRNLYTIVQKGPLAYYGLDDISIEHAPSYLARLKQATLDAPNEAPHLKDYPNKIAYLSALAAFGKAREHKRIEAEKQNQLKEFMQKKIVEDHILKEDGQLSLDQGDEDLIMEFHLGSSKDQTEDYI